MAAQLSRHIVILFEFPTLNGGEHSMLAVLRQLRLQQDLRFTAVAPPTGPLSRQLRDLGIPLVPWTVRAANGHRRDTSQLLMELGGCVLRLQPDLVHANSLSMSRLLGQVQPTIENIVCTGHIRDIMKLSGRAVSDLNRLRQLAVVSQATARFHRDQGVSGEQMFVVDNGIDPDRFVGRPATLAVLQRLIPGLPPGHRLLLNVGQICLRKGQLDLARAVVRLLQDTDDVHLVLLGERHSAKQESRTYEQAIVDEFATVGLSNHLHCPGSVDNVEQWMNVADLLVHAARQEPLGRVLLEAAASGLPIVATDAGGTSEILRDGHSGRLVPPGDVQALTESLDQALRHPRAGATMAAAAAREVRARFTVTQAASALHGFWRNVFPAGNE